MGKAPKYVSAAYLAERTSLTTRWFTRQACEGKIPGAVQSAGPGGAWRFDEDQFGRWWGEKERPPWYPRIGREGRDTGRDAISPTDWEDDNRLERLLGLSPDKD